MLSLTCTARYQRRAIKSIRTLLPNPRCRIIESERRQSESHAVSFFNPCFVPCSLPVCSLLQFVAIQTENPKMLMESTSYVARWVKALAYSLYFSLLTGIKSQRRVRSRLRSPPFSLQLSNHSLIRRGSYTFRISMHTPLSLNRFLPPTARSIRRYPGSGVSGWSQRRSQSRSLSGLSPYSR